MTLGSSLRKRSSNIVYTFLKVLALLTTLILSYYSLLHYRHLKVSTRLRLRALNSSLTGRAAVVTLSDTSFQHCAVSLFRRVRYYGWDRSLVLLAVDYPLFDQEVRYVLDELGVHVIETVGVFDRWTQLGVENVDVWRSLDWRKMRKMELFIHPMLRTFERIIYMDADGIVGGSLEPLVWMDIPENVSIVLRQNDASVRKGTLWDNEMALEMLTDGQMEHLALRYADTELVGGTCWFVVETARLRSVMRVLWESVQALCRLRAGFRLNDQTLISLVFYEQIAVMPWCSWEEVTVWTDVQGIGDYCKKEMSRQRWLTGGVKFIYRHMNQEEKRRCMGNTQSNGFGEGKGNEWESELLGGIGGTSGRGIDSVNAILEEEDVSEDAVAAECVKEMERWRTRRPEETRKPK